RSHRRPTTTGPTTTLVLTTRSLEDQTPIPAPLWLAGRGWHPPHRACWRSLTPTLARRELRVWHVRSSYPCAAPRYRCAYPPRSHRATYLNSPFARWALPEMLRPTVRLSWSRSCGLSQQCRARAPCRWRRGLRGCGYA